MSRPGALAGVLALAAGCEVLVGIHDKTYPSSTDGGGASDVSVGDVSEAGGGVDDGGSAVDGNDGPYPDLPCSQQPQQPKPFFCADFDETDDASTGWGYPFPSMGGMIQISDEYYRSKPHSAQFSAPSNGSAQAQLGLTVPTTHGLTVAFDLRMAVDLTGLPQIGILQIIPANGASGPTLIYAVGSEGAQILVSPGTGTPMGPGTTGPPIMTWTRLVLAYDPTQGLSAFEDGQPLTGVPSLTVGLAAMTQVIVGVVYEYGNEGPSFQADIDNVVVWND